MIISILLPPLAVFLKKGAGKDVLINIIAIKSKKSSAD
ncbi:MAG: YqaE/Pmp3 family membrane protein [Desulfobulbaceae bacterium]|nr:YqaE/Pmp3 family membrane protein [Desulfobulbaceae bacterium]